ncbi:9847_t:CDS:1, partial [Dentiscutata heterogama]
NTLLKEYIVKDLSIYDMNEIDLDTTDNISVFDLEKVSDEDEKLEQIKSLATTIYLIK